MKKVGIFIILLGIGLTIFTAITFFTREKVVEIGKIEINQDCEKALIYESLVHYINL